MNFRDFPENSHNQNGKLKEKLRNHIEGEFVKIPEFTQGIILTIFPQKCKFWNKIENFENSRNSAYNEAAHLMWICAVLNAVRLILDDKPLRKCFLEMIRRLIKFLAPS